MSDIDPRRIPPGAQKLNRAGAAAISPPATELPPPPPPPAGRPGDQERARRAEQTAAARAARLESVLERRADYLRARGYFVFKPGSGICDTNEPGHGPCGWVCVEVYEPETLASLGL